VSPWFPLGIGAMAGALVLVVVVLVGAVTDPSDDTVTTTSLPPGPAPTTTASTVASPTTTTPQDPGETTTPAARPPEAVRVLVVNGAGVPGVAGRITDGLAAAGYQTLVPANADRRSVSTVYARTGYDEECAAVVAVLQARFANPLPTDDLTEAPDAEGRDEADCLALIGDDIVVTD
jgi:hypothetical protein